MIRLGDVRCPLAMDPGRRFRLSCVKEFGSEYVGRRVWFSFSRGENKGAFCGLLVGLSLFRGDDKFVVALVLDVVGRAQRCWLGSRVAPIRLRGVRWA